MYRKISAALLALALGAVRPAQAEQTIYYPTQDAAAFSIAAPDNWKLEPAEEEGGFFTLSGPTGAVLSFRTVEGSEEGLNDAVEETVGWVKENYSNVNIDKPQAATENGLKGFMAGGTGKDKGDGHEVVFVMEWLDLKAGKGIAEVWFCVNKGDQKGLDQAAKIMDTIKAR